MRRFLPILLIVFMFFVTGCKLKSEGNNMTDHKVLVAYFSRTGEQYSVGNISEGNTAIVAKIIADKTNGDLFEIKVKNDNYPTEYNDLTEYAKKELQSNARPEIVGKLENFDQYDTVFIGFPIWWGDKPMPVYTFIDSYNFNGKNIIPFCTHEGSGFCGTQGMDKTGAKILKGLAIYGHTAQNDRTEADKKVSEWLKGLGF